MTAAAERLITQLASGATNPDALSRPEQAAIYRFCRSATSRRQAKIVQEIGNGRSWIARRRQNELLRCLPARLIAAVAAVRRMRKRRLVRPDSDIPFSLVWRLADELRRNMYGPSSYGLARLKPKGAGYQEGVEFEIFDVARQKLLAMSLLPFVRLHPVQFALRVVGRQRARNSCEP